MVSKARLADHNHNIRRPNSGKWFGNSGDASSPLSFSSRSGHGNLYPRPMTHWAGEYPDELMQPFFCQVHYGCESSHNHETSCSDIFDCFSCTCLPDSDVAFNKSALPRSFGCREILSDAMNFHKLTELSSNSHPLSEIKLLMGPAQFIRTISSTDNTSSSLLDGTEKANVESRGKIYNVLELKHLFVWVREYKGIHSNTLVEFPKANLFSAQTSHLSPFAARIAISFAPPNRKARQKKILAGVSVSGSVSWEELACESLCSGTLSSTRFSLNSCSQSGMSEHNGSHRSSGVSFLIGLGFWLAWVTAGLSVQSSLQHLNLTQALDGNQSHSDLPFLESYCRLTQL